MTTTNKLVIGFGYKARTGKDQAGDFVRELREGVYKDSFAKSLKEGIGRGVFGFSDEQLYGDLKEVVDEFWASKLNLYSGCFECGHPTPPSLSYFYSDCPGCHPRKGISQHFGRLKRIPITPRAILQIAGTEAGREIFGVNLWTSTVERRILGAKSDIVVVCDARFPNEIEFIHSLGGYAVKIDRPGILAPKGGVSGHASEKDPGGWDFIIQNDSTLEAFKNKVRRMLETIEAVKSGKIEIASPQYID